MAQNKVAEINIKKELELDISFTMKEMKCLVKQLDIADKKEVLTALILELAILQPKSTTEQLQEILEHLTTK